MGKFKLEQVTGPLGCGEGPHWDTDRKCLYLVDIPNSLVMRYVPETDTLYQAKVDVPTVSLILPVSGTDDKFIIGAGRSLVVITWDGVSDHVTHDSIETIFSVEEDKANNRFNDGKTDVTGRVFAGTMGSIVNGVWEQGRGALYSLTPDRKSKLHLSDVGIANGLAWSSDNKTFYYIDSLAYSVDSLDYDINTGSLSNRRKIFDLKEAGYEGVCDGMTIDTNGNLWVALYGGHCVLCINPNTGNIVRVLPIPSKHVTSVAFGGDNLDELYVTCADQDATEEEKSTTPTFGCTYKVTGLGVTGYPGVSAVL